MAKLRFQDFMEDLASGSSFGVFIDDTGSPGQIAPGQLHPARKSWAAVVIPPGDVAKVLNDLHVATKRLYETTGATEFHFTDVLSGTKEFKNIDLQQRLHYFEVFAELFERYKLPILVQTFDPITLGILRKKAGAVLSEQAGPFDLTSEEDTSLLLVLMRAKWHIEKISGTNPSKAYVFVDEGFKKNGVGIRIESLSSVFHHGGVFFGRSSAIIPLQLADFAAFCLNRTQLIINRTELKPLDKTILSIISRIAPNFINIKQGRVMLDNVSGSIIDSDIEWRDN